jgi:hypothetical protein
VVRLPWIRQKAPGVGATASGKGKQKKSKREEKNQEGRIEERRNK